MAATSVLPGSATDEIALSLKMKGLTRWLDDNGRLDSLVLILSAVISASAKRQD